MSREIRRVPANWEHPRYTADTATRREQIGEFIPLNDDYDKALAQFAAEVEEMGLGPAIESHYGFVPTKDTYACYGDKPRDWFQVYETVSEGTPTTPPFATEEELVQYLMKFGGLRRDRYPDLYPLLSRHQAEAFVKVAWCPSAMVVNGRFVEGIKVASDPELNPPAK